MKPAINNKEKLLVMGLALLLAILLRLLVGSSKSQAPSLEGLEYDGSTLEELSSSVLSFPEDLVRIQASGGSRAPLIQRSHGWVSSATPVTHESPPFRLRGDV